MNDIRSRVIEILRPYTELQIDASVSDKARILEDLKVNSARVIDIILAVEDAFELVIEEDEDRIRRNDRRARCSGRVKAGGMSSP